MAFVAYLLAEVAGLAPVAAAQCGDGHRCFDTGGPGCNNAACCDMVCASLPHCCQTAWDAMCVHAATAWCPIGGWSIRTTTGHLYIELGPYADWLTQQARALAMGGHLVTIESSSDNNLVRNMSLLAHEAPLFIGLSDLEREGDFSWVDGSAPSYTNWATGQPDDLPSSGGNVGADVVELHATDAKWRDAPAWWMRFAIAELDSACGQPEAGDCFTPHAGHSCAWTTCCGSVCVVDPSCCTAAWDDACVDAALNLCPAELAGPLLVHENGHLYGVVFAPWARAREVALALGGELMVINDEAEDGFASEVVFWWCAAFFLTGLNDLDVEGVFEWIDGSPVDFTGWAPGEPDGVGWAGLGEADVMAVEYFPGAWRDESALNDAGTIVEFETSCGLPDAGSCFAAHDTGSCDEPYCCAEVCGQIMACCTLAWDAECVAIANTLCVPITDPCQLWGDCFEPRSDPGCGIEACCAAVCAFDASCCLEAWDAACVATAESLCAGCGTAIAGSCYGNHPAAGCEDASCCAFVCLFLPECCNDSWDHDCAQAAGLTCEPLPVLGPVRNVGNGHDYLVLSRASWPLSQAKAVELGGHLVAIADESEWAFVLALMAPLMHDPMGDGFWIGLTDAATPGTFNWTTGEPVTFSAFAPGEPSGGLGEMYVQYLHRLDPPPAVWNDVPEQGMGVATAPKAYHVPFGVVEIVPAPTCPADLDGNGTIDGADIGLLLAAWGRGGGLADLDASGVVDGADLGVMLAAWGACGVAE